MIGVIAHKGHCQIIPHATVHQVFLSFGILKVQLFAPFQYFKNKLFILSALFAAQIGYVLHTGGLYGSKSEFPIGLFNNPYYIIPKLHFHRQNIFHAGHRLLAKRHTLFSYSSSITVFSPISRFYTVFLGFSTPKMISTWKSISSLFQHLSLF